jgi:hypothetical protein
VQTDADQRAPKRLLQSSFDEKEPALSPTGRWLAYVSNETGRDEVYVQQFPGLGGKRRISTDGGTNPAWSRGARELFYQSSDGIMSVKLSESPVLSSERPQLLFRRPIIFAGPSMRTWDVGPDGRFLMIDDVPSTATTRPVTVVLNWFQELQQPFATSQ